MTTTCMLPSLSSQTQRSSSRGLNAPFSTRCPGRAMLSPIQCNRARDKHLCAEDEQQIQQQEKSYSSRRHFLQGLIASAVLGVLPARAEQKYEQMEALKGKDYGKVRTKYPDFILTDSGLQYKDLRDGSGGEAKDGSRVTVDWDGYTLGYYGRPFEARNKSKGGAFVGDSKDYLKFTLGDHSMIPAFEEATRGMKVGGVRRLIVPQELGYPGQPPDFTKQGPTPGNFSGRRALDFVLKNQGLIDKTLLFDIELLRVD